MPRRSLPGRCGAAFIRGRFRAVLMMQVQLSPGSLHSEVTNCGLVGLITSLKADGNENEAILDDRLK